MKSNGLKSFALISAVFLLLSWLRLDPGDNASSVGATGGGSDDPALIDSELEGEGDLVEETAGAGGEQGGAGAAGAGGAGGAAAGGAGGAAGGGVKTAKGIECKGGANGGATAPGVTAGSIRLATTAVLDGPAKSLLAPSVTGMKAVMDRVNREGGICGRRLELKVVNDSFNSDQGSRYIRNFIDEKYFALPVVPSAEGLGVAIKNGMISQAGIPVVGTDGMREEQYADPWVWPVASATVSSMRIMAKYGFEKKGARSFAIVWDNKYKFGQEGKDAFVKQVEDMGGTIKADQQLDPTQTSYASEASTFNEKCGSAGDPKCDMVAMLLLPDTAKAWLSRNPAPGGKYTSGAQTLFSDDFAQKCVQVVPPSSNLCNAFAVWTGYNPPIGPIATQPGVAQYVSEMRAAAPGIDVNNQFLQGAYLGMSVFTEALKKAGPQLTRQRLREVLDSMDYQTDLASTLSWRPGKHAANVRARAFAMSVSQGTFNGWRDEGTGFLLDPAHGG